MTAPGSSALRVAGLSALVNALGFGAFDVPAIWHLHREHTVWIALDNPTYGHGPFETHGLPSTVPLLLAFLGACLVLALGGALLLIRTTGVEITLIGTVLCAPFWWGFDLPLAWVNAGSVLALIALSWTARTIARPEVRAPRP